MLSKLGWFAFPLSGYFIGAKLEAVEVQRMTLYRDRSALYGRPTPPATPSWP